MADAEAFLADSPQLTIYDTNGTTVLGTMKCHARNFEHVVDTSEIDTSTFCKPNRKKYKTKHSISLTVYLSYTDPDDATAIGLWNTLAPLENESRPFLFQTDDRVAISPSAPASSGSLTVPPIKMIGADIEEKTEFSIAFTCETWATHTAPIV